MTLNVLHVVETLDLQAGSLAGVLYDLIADLPDCGITSSVVTLVGNGDALPAIPPKADVVTFDLLADGVRSTRLRSRLGEMVRRADLVHLHGLWNGLNRLAAVLARQAGVRYVLSPHTMLAQNPLDRMGLKRRIASLLYENRNMRRAACLHAGSQPEARLIREKRLNRRIEMIPLGLNADQYPPSSASHDSLLEEVPALREGRCLLFLGRIHPVEGIIPLLRACEELVDKMRDWHLVLAGPIAGRWRDQMEAAIRRRGESKRVTLLIAPDVSRQRALLARADLLVQPALRESVPVASLQALASAVPVIVSTECDLPQVEVHDAGLVAGPNRKSLRQALDRMLSASDDRRREMGRNGRALVRDHFSAKDLAPRFAELYRSLAGRGE